MPLTTEEMAEKIADAYHEGRLIEAGWIISIVSSLDEDMPEEYAASLRDAFFMGVRYLMHIIQNPPPVGSQKHIRDAIVRELNEFTNEAMTENLH